MATQPVKKGERMEAFVQSLGLSAGAYDPCYLGYFACFNAREYYEAHDVLEHLWLRQSDANHAFYKGLIQLAGAFVHLKKQRARPHHPTDGRRLHPAVRLFLLARKNLAHYVSPHLGLDLDEVNALIDRHVAAIRDAHFHVNPWNPETAPQLSLTPTASP